MKKGYQVLALFCLLFGVQDSKSLLTDKIFPNVNDAIQTEVATAENSFQVLETKVIFSAVKTSGRNSKHLYANSLYPLTFTGELIHI